jgi:hypothetical protein
MEFLSPKEEDFCVTAGIAGVLLAITCLIQHLLLMLPHWITYSMVVGYLLSMAGYFLLARRSPHAFIVIIISSVWVMASAVLMLVSLVFSLVLILLLVYSVVTIVLMAMNDLQKKIKSKALAEKMERESWKGKC